MDDKRVVKFHTHSFHLKGRVGKALRVAEESWVGFETRFGPVRNADSAEKEFGLNRLSCTIRMRVSQHFFLPYPPFISS